MLAGRLLRSTCCAALYIQSSESGSRSVWMAVCEGANRCVGEGHCGMFGKSGEQAEACRAGWHRNSGAGWLWQIRGSGWGAPQVGGRCVASLRLAAASAGNRRGTEADVVVYGGAHSKTSDIRSGLPSIHEMYSMIMFGVSLDLCDAHIEAGYAAS